MAFHINVKAMFLRINQCFSTFGWQWFIDAARKRLQSNWNGTSTNIHFDKQAAFTRKLRIIDDNQELPPLGSIEMIVTFDSEQEFEEFVNWFTPPTKDGKIINH